MFNSILYTFHLQWHETSVLFLVRNFLEIFIRRRQRIDIIKQCQITANLEYRTFIANDELSFGNEVCATEGTVLFRRSMVNVR